MSFVGYRIETEWKPQPLWERLREASAERTRHVAADIRYEARRSLRYARNPSRPGQPPHLHRNRGGASKLLNILFAQRDPMTVIAGPMKMSAKAGMIARDLEFGGTVIGPFGQRAYVEARPYMRPALYRATMSVANLWQGSL